MIKVHLKNPSLDGNALLSRKRIFTLHLDGGLRVLKISKDYDNPTPKDLLTVKVKSKRLRDIPAHQLLAEVIYSSFCRGQEFEIIQVNKIQEDSVAYLTAATSKQCTKIFIHQMTFNHKILVLIIASQGALSRKEIQRRNCLTLIIKDCHIYYCASKVIIDLQKLMGDNNVVKTYYKNRVTKKDLLAGVCNLEVLNPTVYKQHVKTTAQIFNKYVTFKPHLRSLDGINEPLKEVLKEFGFLDVNNTIAGTVIALLN